MKRFLGAFKILAQQLVKSMSRTMPFQNLPRPIVEHGLYAFDLAPRHVIEAGASGKELAQQPVGVLVRTPLPRTLRVRKVHLHLGLLGKEPMLPHLLPPVIRERGKGDRLLYLAWGEEKVCESTATLWN